jgi:acetyltransferase-like isoleucine patch superfamily enzyme
MPTKHLEHDWYSQPLPDNVALGERTWLYSSFAFSHYGCRSTEGVRVGNDAGLYPGTFFELGPDAEVIVGDYCSLVGAIMATNGRLTIGDYTFIAHEVIIADNHWALPADVTVRSDQLAISPVKRNNIEIGCNVWIGAQAIIIGNVRIGDGAIIGAGTLVTRDVPAYTLCAGNPMRVVRAITAGDKRLSQ